MAMHDAAEQVKENHCQRPRSVQLASGRPPRGRRSRAANHVMRAQDVRPVAAGDQLFTVGARPFTCWRVAYGHEKLLEAITRFFVATCSSALRTQRCTDRESILEGEEITIPSFFFLSPVTYEAH